MTIRYVPIPGTWVRHYAVVRSSDQVESRPSEHIDAVVAGHHEVLRSVTGLSNANLPEPSLLPGWPRAMVVAHLAHKSRSHAQVFRTSRDQVPTQYPDGQRVAEAETDEWSRRNASELCELLKVSFRALEDAWADLPDDGWARRGISSAGERSMVEFVHRHLRDVFVHHVDLNVGYRPAQWPTVFVATELPKRLADLPRRAEPDTLLAWLLGRTPAPTLAPW